jgi:hypothetical protein
MVLLYIHLRRAKPPIPHLWAWSSVDFHSFCCPDIDLHPLVGGANLASRNRIVGSPAVVKDYSRRTSDIVAEKKACQRCASKAP